MKDEDIFCVSRTPELSSGTSTASEILGRVLDADGDGGLAGDSLCERRLSL